VRLLCALRAGYGAALLAAPGAVVRLYSAGRSDPRARAIARLLGARHLLQALVTADRPAPVVVALGAETDLAHAASMVLLAAADPPHRRPAMIDALAAGSFALAGALTTRRARHPDAGAAVPSPLARLAVHRNTAARGIARFALPASIRRRVDPPVDPPVDTTKEAAR